jgi:hypothetical protein
MNGPTCTWNAVVVGKDTPRWSEPGRTSVSRPELAQFSAKTGTSGRSWAAMNLSMTARHRPTLRATVGAQIC